MSAPTHRLTQRAGGLLLMTLLSGAHLAPIGALWLGDEACCGCTNALCCRSPRPAPPPPASMACHDAAGSKDDAVLKCASPVTDFAPPFVARGVLPAGASLEAPARSRTTTALNVLAPLFGTLRIDLPPPRQVFLAS